jgi:hypothetical protein
VNLPLWPFTLVRPPGYTGGSVPTPAELQELQEKVAASADGRVWTDFSLYKSWTGSSVSPITVIGTFDPVSRRWILQATTMADTGQWSVSGNKWFVADNPSVAPPSGPNLAIASLLANNTGITLAGGQPATSSDSKLARSIDGGSTWTRIAIGASSTGTVVGLGYSLANVMWFAAVTGEGIFSSADGGATWVNRFAAAAYCNFMARDGASPLILAMRKTNAGANAEYATSTNGTVWTTRTFPVNLVTAGGVASDGLLQGVYSEYLGKFFQPTPSGIYSSPDGISWTLVTASYTTGGLAVSGRVMLRGDGRASLDGAVWYPVLDAANNNLVVIASPFGGACFADNTTNERFVSLQGGF